MMGEIVELDVTVGVDKGLWGWFVGLGVVLTMLGLIISMNLFTATLAAIYLLGGLMCLGAVLQLGHALHIRRRGGAMFWGVSGLFYLLASAAVLYDPVFAVRMVTLFIGIMLGASGAVRLAIAIGGRERGWGWLFLSGLISAAAAAFVVTGWPTISFWLLGLILAVDLVVQGIMMVLFGLSLRLALCGS